MADDLTDDLPPEEAPEPIQARMSVLTIVLFGLNILAALGFAFLLALDYQKRQEWSTAVFRHDLALWGLPLEEDDAKANSGWETTKPPQRLDPEQIAKEFNQRNRGARVSEKFQPVEEPIGQRIKPSQLSDETLRELFTGLGTPVKTLQQEVQRVQDDVLNQVKTAADEFAQTAKDKRATLTYLVLPLAAEPWQINAASESIRSLPGQVLDGAVVDAAQRLMLVSALKLLHQNRPLEAANPVLTRSALFAQKAAPDNLFEVKLEDIQAQFRQRCQEAMNGGPGELGKESYEKRRNIAYLLMVVAQMRKPDLRQPLFDKGPERAQAVVGLEEYLGAAQGLALALEATQKELLAAISADRDGTAYKAGTKEEKTPGFVGRYEELVQRIVTLVGDLKEQETRLDLLKTREEQHKKQYAERKEYYEENVNKLIAARAETALLAAELRRLEDQLFQAQRELADAARGNERLLGEIRNLEQSARRKGRQP
jgi:hypothetical protein